MTLLKLLWRESPCQFLLAIISSLITAIMMLSLVSLLSHYLGHSQRPTNWWQFLLLAMLSVFFQVGANVFISSLTQKTIQLLRFNLVRRILYAPLISLEQSSSSALLTSLIDDAGRIAYALPGIVALVRDMTFIIVCFVYLGWLDYKPLAIIIGVIFIGAIIHSPLQKLGTKHIAALREREQRLFSVFKNMIEGIKQIKLGIVRENIVSHLDDSQKIISKYSTNSLLAFAVANAYAVLLFLSMLEILIFGNFATFINHQVLMAYTLTLMFLLGPLQTISNTTQQLGSAEVALNRIRALEISLKEATTEIPERGVPIASLSQPSFSNWTKLAIAGVTHRFQSSEREDFDLGPFDLILEPGTVLFVVGGNGSGKTTFAKLASGLYAPQTGVISMDNTPVTEANRHLYRKQFGAVFADFNLFDGLAGTEHDPLVGDHMDLVRQLKLDHVIDPGKGLFAQAASFSSGERRRVAMLLTCLGEKSAYVFDEFAADQDPNCRELFYYEIVPRLQKKGKLIIVITHDTRFFDCADMILTLERGMPPVLQNVKNPIHAVVG
jgi:putative ATP-binding cassette transporter